MQVYVYVCTYVFKGVLCMNVCIMYEYMHISMYVCIMYEYMHVSMYVCVCMYVCIMYVRMHVYMYVYMSCISHVLSKETCSFLLCTRMTVLCCREDKN